MSAPIEAGPTVRHLKPGCFFYNNSQQELPPDEASRIVDDRGFLCENLRDALGRAGIESPGCPYGAQVSLGDLVPDGTLVPGAAAAREDILTTLATPPGLVEAGGTE
jgi:hypothetical protein